MKSTRIEFTARHPLALIGCGNMGQALALGWRRAFVAADALLPLDRNPQKRCDFYAQSGCDYAADIASLAARQPAAICVAVKPHQLEEVLSDITAHCSGFCPLVFSVIAGVSTSFYMQHLWEGAAIVRVMPNTPSRIGMGMSGCYANANVTESQRELIDRLMQAVGKTLWLENEMQMHALTAVSGSGPAYCFYWLECLVDAALAQGLDAGQARLLCAQTMAGAAQMVLESEEAISTLRERVTSPNGTTAAGLAALMQPETAQRVHAVIAAAAQRSKELSGQN